MKIASWNVNSLNVRLPHLQQWLQDFAPDVVALQETKLEDARFPDSALAELGYRSVFCGQKTYNGVALLSRVPFAAECITAIPGFDDPQKRVLAATVGDVRIVNLYVVNGESVGSEKFSYKLRWLAAVREWLREELLQYPNLVVLGDFNIAPDDRDVHDPKRWREKILCSTPSAKRCSRCSRSACTTVSACTSPTRATTAGGITAWRRSSAAGAAHRPGAGQRSLACALHWRGHRHHATWLGASQRPHAGMGAAGLNDARLRCADAR